MKFLKQNFLTLIVLVILLINVYKLNDLQVKYSQLNLHYSMLQSKVQNLSNNINSNRLQSQPKQFKEVMSPLDLAEYLNIDMMVVYGMTEKDSTMPYTEINGEYRFNKAAIDKWMETRNIIMTK